MKYRELSSQEIIDGLYSTEYSVIERDDGKYFCIGHSLDLDDIVDELNRLSKENEELKEHNKVLCKEKEFGW